MTARRSEAWKQAIRDGIRKSEKHNRATGPGHQRWLGGEMVDRRGYRWIWLSPEERARHTCSLKDGKYIQEHKLKAERAVGRCLTKREVVHHLNGDKLDNRNGNLLVCTQAYHMQLHQRMAQAWMREHLTGA